MAAAQILHDGPHVKKTIKLNYFISYLKIFEKSFRAMDDNLAFDLLGPAVRAPLPPNDTVPPGLDVIVTRAVLEDRIPIMRRQGNLLQYAPRQAVYFYTDLRVGLRNMSSKTRATLQRKVRRFEDFCGGQLDWKMYRTPDEMGTFHQLAREVARKTYQERLFDAGIPDSPAFIQDMMSLAARDLVRGSLLFQDGKPIAYLYSPAPDGYLVYDSLGYDPEYSTHSPGSILQYLTLEELSREGRFNLYSWGSGYTQAKQTFSTGQVLAADVYFYKPTVSNFAFVLLHRITDGFSEAAGSFLERLGLKQKIRRWLKRQ